MGSSELVFKCLLIVSAVIGLANCIKPLGSVCDPALKECGLNAACSAITQCKFGRCSCISDSYRPIGGNSVPFDCGRFLKLGENCSALTSGLIDAESGHECRDGLVSCMINLEPQSGQCVPNKFVKTYGEFCNDTQFAVCNQFVGLICSVSKENATLKTCQCPTGKRIFINSRKYPFGSLCVFPEYHEACDDAGQCRGNYKDFPESSVCNYNSNSIAKGICDCSAGYEPIPYVTVETDNVATKTSSLTVRRYCAHGQPLKVGAMDNCTAVGPGTVVTINGAITCQEGLVCYACPALKEDSSSQTAGRCLSISSILTNDASRVPTQRRFSSTTALMFILVTVIFRQA